MSTQTASIPLQKLFFSRTEIAQLLGISVGTVDNLIECGDLPSIKLGGRVRGRVLVSRDALLQLVAKSSRAR